MELLGEGKVAIGSQSSIVDRCQQQQTAGGGGAT